MTIAWAAAGVLSPAAAHTGLKSTSPTDGARAIKAPQQIKLRFSGDIDRRFATLALTVGATRRPLTRRVDGPQVVATVPAVTGNNGGEWKVSYRVVSSDGHPIAGSISFTVAAASSSSPPTPSAGSTASTPPRTPAPPSPSTVQTATPATPSAPQSVDPRTGLPATDTHARRRGGWILFALGAAFLVLAPIGVALGGISRPKVHEPPGAEATSDEAALEEPGAEQPAATAEKPPGDS